MTEKNSQPSVNAAAEDPVLGMAQRWQEVRDAAEATIDAIDECPDEIFNAQLDPVIVIEREMFMTPATSVKGVLEKLRIYLSVDTTWNPNEQPRKEMPLDQLGMLCVLRDLKGLAG